jgi:hypothetical protein
VEPPLDSRSPNDVEDPVYLHRKSKTDTTTDPGFDYEAWKTKHMKFAVEATPGGVKEAVVKYKKANSKIACVGSVHGMI